jgi:5-methylcytosine-specific restriction protein A
MAVTHGHGNPKWSRDETILALDLYFQCEGKIPSKSDDRVVELSKLLRNHPLHQDAAKNSTFRNPVASHSN